MQRGGPRGGGGRGRGTRGPGGGGGGGQHQGQGGTQQQQRQDWKCAACGDLQFARNVECRRCGAAKPTAFGETPPTAEHAAPSPRQTPVQAPAPAQQQQQEEDWQCAVCDDLQFARNAKCRRCGMAKPTDEAVKIAEARRLREKQTVEKLMNVATDWTCTVCDHLQFARNTKCRRCGTAKPTREEAREYKARKRAEAQAAEAARAEREAQVQAEIKRRGEEMAAHERRLTAAVWAQARLLAIGACDEASPLSRLPPELVEAIARWATARQACWASSRLAWFKAQARANPADDGSTAGVRVTTYDADPYGDKPWPEDMRGYTLTYHHSRRKPDQAADEPFTVGWWQTHGSTHTSGFTEYWTEARFLAKASYDANWKQWLSSSDIHAFRNLKDK